ncbi:hypothetical protein GCM10022233_29240 [Streptomyces shaanxiensis]|uniref:Uncharacterized protein n=1 Tax=Streptomyces shaanxiensis TaxID=653357 RepID=A0ABP7UYI6_9ACTN
MDGDDHEINTLMKVHTRRRHDWVTTRPQPSRDRGGADLSRRLPMPARLTPVSPGAGGLEHPQAEAPSVSTAGSRSISKYAIAREHLGKCLNRKPYLGHRE